MPCLRLLSAFYFYGSCFALLALAERVVCKTAFALLALAERVLFLRQLFALLALAERVFVFKAAVCLACAC